MVTFARNPLPASRPPATVRALTALMALFAFISVVGSFIFAFPEGWPLGYVVGIVLIGLGGAYASIALRLRRGERWAWRAALALPITHVVAMSAVDLVVLGEIPSENYPVLALSAFTAVLLLVPRTRRFFN